MLRIDINARDLGDRGRVVLGSVGNPFENGLIVSGVSLVELIAGVRHLPHALLNQRAFLRNGEIDAAADHFTREADIVTIRIHTEERETEAVFTASGTVTATLITASPHEDRHHILAEGNGTILEAIFNLDRGAGGETTDGRDHFSLTFLGDGVQGVAIKISDLLISQGQRRISRDITGRRVLESGENDDAVEVALRLKGELIRKDLQLFDGRQLKFEVGEDGFLSQIARGELHAGGPDSPLGDPVTQ